VSWPVPFFNAVKRQRSTSSNYKQACFVPKITAPLALTICEEVMQSAQPHAFFPRKKTFGFENGPFSVLAGFVVPEV
jgi:hypothetical protein